MLNTQKGISGINVYGSFLPGFCLLQLAVASKKGSMPFICSVIFHTDEH